MINDDKRAQTAGDGSTNTQANEVTINNGISYRDAKEIALDVFKSNFLELRTTAEEIARSRAEEITENFLRRIRETNPDALSSMNTPGMQMAIFEAQKSYAKTGDKELENILVDILVDRSETNERDLKQITLDDAIQIAPKLTEEHLAILTVKFMLVHSSHVFVTSFASLEALIISPVVELSKKISGTNSATNHLMYTGCTYYLQMAQHHNVEKLISQKYPSLFAKGFSEDEVRDIIDRMKVDENDFCASLHQDGYRQFIYTQMENLNASLKSRSVSQEEIEKIENLFRRNSMNDQQCKDILISKFPDISRISSLWHDKLRNIDLTPIGIVIAISNYNRIFKSSVKVDNWINI